MTGTALVLSSLLPTPGQRLDDLGEPARAPLLPFAPRDERDRVGRAVRGATARSAPTRASRCSAPSGRDEVLDRAFRRHALDANDAEPGAARREDAELERAASARTTSVSSPFGSAATESARPRIETRAAGTAFPFSSTTRYRAAQTGDPRKSRKRSAPARRTSRRPSIPLEHRRGPWVRARAARHPAAPRSARRKSLTGRLPGFNLTKRLSTPHETCSPLPISSATPSPLSRTRRAARSSPASRRAKRRSRSWRGPST